MSDDATRDALDEFYKSMYKRTRNTGRAAGNRPWTQAILSDALAIHPSQIKEAMEFDRKHGVPTEYAADGRPKLTDRKHRSRYMKLHCAFDRDAGYGDVQPGTTRGQDKDPGPAPDYSHLTEGAFKEKIDYRGLLK